MNEIKVSIIIPVYNVEKYIEECMESVVNQTLEEIEIIIVNDGTQDNSMKKIERFLSDDRIIIINKENAGASSARNLGIKLAEGEYISFVDSDDFIEKTMLEDLYCTSNNHDIIFSDFIFYDEKSKKEIKNEREILFSENKGSYFYLYGSTVVWNKIYRREFLLKNNLFFKEGIIYEDELFTFKSSFLAEKIKYVKKYHYYYRNNREGSIMNTLKREKSIDSYEKIIFEIKKFKNEYNWSLFEKSRIFLCENYFVSYLYKMKDQNFKREEVREFENELKEYYKNKFSKIEKKILKQDINKILKLKKLYLINIFDKFYWENRLFTKKNFRRILEGKVKNIFN